MKDKLEAEIEIHRHKNINAASNVILYRIMAYIQRKKYIRIRSGIIIIQKTYKVSTSNLIFFAYCSSYV